MAGPGVILRTIAAVLVVMLAGALARRRGVLTAEGTASLGRLVTDVALPALCFKGLAGMGSAALARNWAVPVLGAASLALGAAVGALVAPLVCPAASRRTFVFCAAMSNWIYLPLPLADALYGDAGTAVVVLGNAGAQVFLWTAGLAILGGRVSGARALLLNPGLWATALGLASAVAWPGVTSVPVLTEAIDLVASATIPLATLAIGAQLAAPASGPTAANAPLENAGAKAVAALAAIRLVVVPAIAATALIAWRDGVDPVVRGTEILIAAMPVSLTAGSLVERGGGDVRLSSRAILATTLLGVVTVPAVHFLASRAAVAP